MIKPPHQLPIRCFRLISGWKYAQRSGSHLIGQGYGCQWRGIGAIKFGMNWRSNRTLIHCALALWLVSKLVCAQAQGGSAAQGWRILFDQRLGNCVACHSIPDAQGKKSGIQSTFAPALDGVASRLNPDDLRQWLVDARRINPDTLMPPFGLILRAEQIEDALAALQTLR
jgi:mono/diheme cytochrome c family protein